MVGREHERERLRATLTAAWERRGQVVLIAGEPGIGKTRLAEEAVRLAATMGMASAWGRAVDDEGSPPFWLFRQVLRSLAHDAEDPWPKMAAGATESGPVPHELRVQERFLLFEAVTSYIVAAADTAGLLVVLDDLQWADASSLRLLVHLVGAIGTAPIAVVGTYRDAGTRGRDVLHPALGELARNAALTRLRLAGLTTSQVAEQLTAVTARPVPAEVAAAVCRRSQGNPFFVGELAEVLEHISHPDEVAGVLPDGVRDAVRNRVAVLSDSARTVVATAAILGTAVDIGGLAHVTGLDAVDVFAALDEAAGVVARRAGQWEFVHGLVRDAALADAPHAAQLDAHRRMAEYLQRHPHAEANPAQLAHHWLASIPLGEATQAAFWAERAARAASNQCAWEEAAVLYRRAAEVVEDQARRCELLVDCATAQRHAHQMRSARETVLQAARLARGLADGSLLARAALVMAGMNDLGWAAHERALCEEAIALLPDADSPTRARLLAQLSVDYLMFGYVTPDDSDRAGELSRAALAMAERLADPAAMRSALHARQMACNGPDGVSERLALGDRFIAHGVADNDDVSEMWGRLWRFDALMQLGDLNGAEGVLPPLMLVVDRLRLPLASWHLLHCQGSIALARGRFVAARRFGEQALTLARRGDHEGGLLPSQGFLALLGTLTGFADEADTRMLDGWEHIQPFHPMMALVHWSAGSTDDARRAYTTGPSIDELPGFLLLPAAAALIELAEAFEDRPVLDAAYQRLAPHADLFCCGGAGVIATTGSVHGPLGVAAAALGRVDDGVRQLRRAIEINERAGAPPFVATARYDLARTLARRRRPGDRDEATALAELATAAAKQLGMDPLRARAEELTATLTGSSRGPLTRREREIAAFVAQGLTNRQIAAATHISERTAENHVQHILGKLGFSTRAQISAWVTRSQ